jgi:hypothetical protein
MHQTSKWLFSEQLHDAIDRRATKSIGGRLKESL